MMFSRPRFLSSVWATCQGAHAELVAANMSSRALRIVEPTAVGLEVHGRQLPDLAGVVYAAFQPARLFIGRNLQPVL